MIKTAMCALAFSMISFQAQAYKDGTYTCKNGDATVPDHVYKIESVSVGASGAKLPYIDITSYYRAVSGDPKSPIHEVHIRGIATYSSSSPTSEVLSVGSLRFEFDKDDLVNCRK